MRHQFYSDPQNARPPGGETLQEVQTRAVLAVTRAFAAGHDGPVLCVSHADVIRTLIAHYLRWSLQDLRQIRIDHASLTALEIQHDTVSLLFLNHVPT